MPKITPAMKRVFKGKETPAEEKAERKLVPNKKAYKAVEKVLEPDVKNTRFACGGKVKGK